MAKLAFLILLIAAPLHAQGEAFRETFAKQRIRSPRVATSGSVVFDLPASPVLADQCSGASLESNDGVTVTWTRSTGKYCTKADGTMVWLTANQPSLTASGIHPEGTGTNLVIRSQEIDNTSTAWTHDAVTVTANTQTAPDGTATAETVTTTALSGQHRFFSQQIVLSNRVLAYIAIGPVSGSAHWARAVPTSVINAGQSCNLATCSAGTTQGFGGGALPIGGCEALANGYCLLWFQYTGDGTNGQRVIVKLGRSDAETVTGAAWSGEALVFKAWGAGQYNSDVWQTYYPTGATSATRGADVVSASIGTDISAVGCASATITLRSMVASNGRIIGTSDTSSPLLTTTSTTSKITDGTNTQTLTHPSVLNAATVFRGWWSSVSGTKNIIVGSTSGTADTFDGTMNMGTIYLGSRSGTNDFLNATIKNIKLGTSANGCQ